MKRYPLFSFVIVVLLVLVTGCAFGRGETVSAQLVASSSADFSEPIDFERVDYARLHAAVFEMTNAVRKKHGRAELEPSPLLSKAAWKYAQRMADKGFLSHHDPYDPKMRTPKDRVTAGGAENALPAENIATAPGLQFESGEPLYVLDPEGPVVARSPDGPPIEPHTYASFAAAVVEQWMNSPGHRKNLLSKDALELGVGAAYYLQDNMPSFVVVQKFQLFEPLR